MALYANTTERDAVFALFDRGAQGTVNMTNAKFLYGRMKLSSLGLIIALFWVEIKVLLRVF